jgi:hypothetical protein
MLRRSLAARVHWLEGPVNYERAQSRRAKLEQRRIDESAWHVPPVEPSAAQATRLYRAMLKDGTARLRLTDKAFFKRRLREEFEVTARRTSARVRGMMYEKGQWMLRNDMGGII